MARENRARYETSLPRNAKPSLELPIEGRSIPDIDWSRFSQSYVYPFCDCLGVIVVYITTRIY